MFIILLLILSCTFPYYSFNKAIGSIKGKKEEDIKIDWLSDPYKYSSRSDFVEKACEDILSEGLFEGKLFKLFRLIEVDKGKNMSYIWSKCSEVVIVEKDILGLLVKDLIKAFYRSKNSFCLEVIDSLLPILEESGNLKDNLTIFFEEAVIYHNFDLAYGFLFLIRKNKMKCPPLLVRNLVIIRMQNHKKEAIDIFDFCIDNELVYESEIPTAIEISTRLKEIGLTIKLMDLFKKKGWVTDVILDKSFFCNEKSRESKSYNRKVIKELYLNFDRYGHEDMVKIIQESLLLGKVSIEILVILIDEIYSKYGEEFLLDILSIYRNFDKLPLNREDALDFLEFLKGNYQGCKKDIRKMLENNFIDLVTNTKGIVRKAYISDINFSLELYFFIEVIKILYNNKSKEAFLEEINYIDKKGKSSLFIGSDRIAKYKKITTLLFGESKQLPEEINSILRENVSKLSSITIKGLTYYQYNRRKRFKEERKHNN